MKKLQFTIPIILLCAFVFGGCISGELAKPEDYLEGVNVLRYVTAESSDGEIVWNGSSLDENGEPIPVPSLDEMKGNTMFFDNYMKIQLGYSGGTQKVITAIKFNIVSDRDGVLRIVIRNNANVADEPIFVKTFNLKANEGDGFVLAGINLSAENECLYIGNEPPAENIKDYEGYRMKWKIKDLQIVVQDM